MQFLRESNALEYLSTDRFQKPLGIYPFFCQPPTGRQTLMNLLILTDILRIFSWINFPFFSHNGVTHQLACGGEVCNSRLPEPSRFSNWDLCP